jgi:PAS domain S-box-containing protein
LKKFRSSFRTPDWRSISRYFAQLLGVAAVYFALAKFGLQLASINPSASPIWPPTGVAIAAVLLCGVRIWPAILVGAFAANATTAGTWETSAVIAFGNTLEAVAGGYLTRIWSQGRLTFNSPAGVARFALILVGIASVISASIGVSTLCAAGLASWNDFRAIWTTWWLGDLAGGLVVTPFVVLWVQSGWRGLAIDLRQTIQVLTCAVIVGMVAFSPLMPQSVYTSPLGFLAVLPLVWAALRRGPRDTATVGLILASFAVWGALTNAGPFAAQGLNESFMLLIVFMISVSVPSLALAADVMVRKRTEDNLRRTYTELDQRVRERTAALNDANIHMGEAQRLADLGSWSWDILSNRVTWSDQLHSIYGVRAGEFGGTVDEFIRRVHADDRARVHASITQALKRGRSFKHDERIVRPDGEVRYLQSVGEVIRDERGVAVKMLGVCLDVTERRKAEEERRQAESALHQSEESYRLLVEGVRDYAIYMLDPKGYVRNWNPGAKRIKGYDAEEVIGKHFRKFYTEEDREAGVPEQALKVAARDGRYEDEGWHARKDGSQFYALVVIDAIRDDKGELVGFAKITRDITQQREAQIALDKTREQLAQAQKMEAIGQLTGGIAHDFNNLLMIVSGYAQILQRKLTDTKDIQAIEAIRAATGRGEKLTRQLLAFSRRQQLMPVVVDLRQRIDAVRDMLAPSLRGNIKLVTNIEENVWPVEVDLNELELALVNIAVNARDAMPNGGTITLSARNVQLKPGSAAGALEGDFVALTMLDTGNGIEAENLKRVFEPFFTTKPVGKGTGLGLSQVHGFANQSGGAVTVSSEVGKGTAVTIYLPRGKNAAAVEGREEHTPEQVRGTVLVVEDSPEVAEVTSTLLEQIGFRVVRAAAAEEALHQLQQGIAIDVLFSDIVMPGEMNGMALAQVCRERYPHIPILLTSGFSDAAQQADGRFNILRKPFELSALERAIETAISGNKKARRRARA